MLKLISFDVGIKNLAYCIIESNNGNEFIQNISGIELTGTLSYAGITSINGGFNIGLRKIVFPKSYITFSAAAPVGAAYSFVFGIYYK